ncbi:MAG: cell division protein FtsZ [Candidatus Marsarchaeota archaeon]|jgi:cell division protein FtsZ|nr:cell division protein FtsZ [Candidatus Marsarchaeota archaeon]
MTDIDYKDFVARLAVVGAGGQGSNLVNRLYSSRIKSATTIAVNTDAKHLNMIGADKKILIGKTTTKGMGAGGFPEVAAKAASADIEEIRDAIRGYDMIFLCAGMGGGTGTGSAPVIAKAAKEEGALVVAFVTYPFSLERSRKLKADWGIEQLGKNADTTIIIENDRILSYAPNLQMEKAFELIDSIAANAIKGISDTLTFPSLINLDFADVKSVMRNAGTAVINLGIGSGHDKVNKAIRSTLDHPLLEVGTSGGKNALIHVSGGASLTIEEATRIGGGVTENLDENANVIFGARLSPDAGDQIKVMSIITGVKPMLGKGSRLSGRSSNNLESNLDSLAGLDGF